MLTRKQHDLLLFIHDRIKETGVSPSFDEMKEALQLASKSGIHRLITALEERGFLRRLPHRARALEVVKLPNEAAGGRNVVSMKDRRPAPARVEAESAGSVELPLMGRIAAGTPIEAIQDEIDRVPAPTSWLGKGEHYFLEVKGDSMMDAGILNGDYVLIQRTDTAHDGEIVVALVDDHEATLKRLRRKGRTIELIAENDDYDNQEYPGEHVKIQGRLVGLSRRYH